MIKFKKKIIIHNPNNNINDIGASTVFYPEFKIFNFK